MRASTAKLGGPAPRRTSYAGRAVFIAVMALLFGPIRSGVIKIPLPGPAAGKHVNVVPPDVLPWRPRPLEGPFAPNSKLQQAVRLFEGRIQGSESVAVSPEGNLVMLDKFNRVWEASPGAGGGFALAGAPAADLGAGRPLGYHFDAAGDLIVCDSFKGLVKLHRATGEVEILTNRVSAASPVDAGSEIFYTNDLDIGADGVIYFTSCTDIQPQKGPGGFWDTYRGWQLDLSQGAPRGRLLSYDPATRVTRVLAKGFYYANGAALSPAGDYLMMVETNRIRVHRHWLRGPKAGQTEVVLDNLPGVPDGISRASDGHFWLSLLAPVPPIAKLLREPGVRAAMAWMPDWARPKPKKWGAVAKISGSGEVLDFLHDPTGEAVAYISAVSEAGGRLYIGNLVEDYVSVLDLAAVGAAVGDVPTASH